MKSTPEQNEFSRSDVKNDYSFFWKGAYGGAIDHPLPKLKPGKKFVQLPGATLLALFQGLDENPDDVEII